MKVLVADRGDAVDDFAWAVPGELVRIAEVCTRDEAGDGNCGCARSFVGLSSHKATTVARVVDMPGLDLDELTAAMRTGLADAGWSNVDEFAGDMAEEIAELAGDHPDDTRFRRSFDDLEPL